MGIIQNKALDWARPAPGALSATGIFLTFNMFVPPKICWPGSSNMPKTVRSHKYITLVKIQTKNYGRKGSFFSNFTSCANGEQQDLQFLSDNYLSAPYIPCTKYEPLDSVGKNLRCQMLANNFQFTYWTGKLTMDPTKRILYSL